MLTSVQKKIVVTGTGMVQHVAANNQYRVQLHMNVDGQCSLLEVDISKYEKRLSCSIKTIRDLVGLDLKAEERLRNAALSAFVGELNAPVLITGVSLHEVSVS